jgi:hypothetical protein
MWQQEEDVFNSGKECLTEDYLLDANGTMHALILWINSGDQFFHTSRSMALNPRI